MTFQYVSFGFIYNEFLARKKILQGRKTNEFTRITNIYLCVITKHLFVYIKFHLIIIFIGEYYFSFL